MSDELDEDETPQPRERVVRVRVEDPPPSTEELQAEVSRYRAILSELAVQELREKKDELKETFPDYVDEIDELSAGELAQFELARLREQVAEPEPIPRSKGVVSLYKPRVDVVTEVFTREFDTAEDMMDALVDLSFAPNLTPQQRQRIEQAKDTLWHKFNTSKTQPTRTIVAEKLPDAERFFKCRFCGRYIDHNERLVHSSICGDKFSEVVK